MISYSYETDFNLAEESEFSNWLSEVISHEKCNEGEINYIFCNDDYLYKINVEYLDHDTYTDIITFDYTVGKELHGDIFISIDRVKENAEVYKCSFKDELARVMVHGVLHLVGYKDKSTVDSTIMRAKEDYHLSLFEGLK